MTLLDPTPTRRPKRLQGAEAGPAGAWHAQAGPAADEARVEGRGHGVQNSRAPLLERLVRGRLRAIEAGTLTLRSPEGIERFGTACSEDGLDAVATVHDARFWRALALRGNVGAGEAYALGWWSSPEPTDVVRLMVRNREALLGLQRGFARLSLPVLKAYHALRDNTRTGSARNISAHYDLSNAFFALFLDPTMTYSSALWKHEDATLEEAQIAKIDRLCERLQLGPDDHLLEVGTGWGGFAVRAAERFGCRVTTTTISREQHAFARERVAGAGLSDRIEVLLQDYRDLKGTFTKAVSVEMVEAVGARHYPKYFESIAHLLAPGGAFAVQAITIHDRHYDYARRTVDFIKRHIFPGSCIPSVTALAQASAASSDLRLVHMEDFGTDYARTLRQWRDTLRTRRDDALALGFDDDFLRLFDYYFAYCEGGFLERHISVAHLVFAKEGHRFAPPIARDLLIPQTRGAQSCGVPSGGAASRTRQPGSVRARDNAR